MVDKVTINLNNNITGSELIYSESENKSLNSPTHCDQQGKMHCVFFLFLLFLIYLNLLSLTRIVKQNSPNFMCFSTDFVLCGPLLPPYYLLLALCCYPWPSVSSTCCWTGDSLCPRASGHTDMLHFHHADTMGSPSGLNG